MQEHYPTQDELRWQAVAARDPDITGRFLFGVRSTGIFCRPGCPSRLPRRDQVVFFEDSLQALQAGFRPCKRCQPTGDPPQNTQAALVSKVCALLDAVESPLSLAELGRMLAVSPYHLQRVFKAVLGISPRQYAAARRLERFKQAAREGVSLNSAVYAAGYGSTSRLYEQAGTRLGMTPGSYAAGGKAVTITYTISDCALGRLLLAATDRGIAGLALDDEDAPLLAFLQSEFPGAVLQRDDERLQPWVKRIQSYLSGEDTPFSAMLDLPMDARATAFQARVWEALRQIPAGETRTYTQVAEGLGQPNAVRAVARACATNPVSLLTPCHRVVRADGSLAGYRWGLARKQALLNLERSRRSR